MCQTAQEKGNTYEGITAIVALWIDDTAITLATYHGMNVLHLGGDIHLAYCSSCIFATMLLGHITESTGRRQVADSIARSMAQHIIGHAHQGIFLAKHLAVLADESQAVNIRVNNDTHVVATLLQLVHDATEVLLQWLRIVSEVAGRLTVQEGILHS